MFETLYERPSSACIPIPIPIPITITITIYHHVLFRASKGKNRPSLAVTYFGTSPDAASRYSSYRTSIHPEDGVRNYILLLLWRSKERIMGPSSNKTSPQLVCCRLLRPTLQLSNPSINNPSIVMLCYAMPCYAMPTMPTMPMPMPSMLPH